MPLQTYLHIAVENRFKLFLRHARNLGNEIHKFSTNAVVSRDFSCLRKETEEFKILEICPPTPPSDNLTLTSTSHFGQNVGLTIGWVGVDYQTIIFVTFMFNTSRNWRVTGRVMVSSSTEKNYSVAFSLIRFHLNGHTLGHHQQTQMLETPYLA